MFRGLRFRILAGMLLVIIVGVMITAVNATRTTSGEFRRYVARGQSMRMRRLSTMLGEHYTRQKSWQDVQPLVDQFQEMMGMRILLADTNMNVVADSEGERIGAAAGDNWSSRILSTDGMCVGYLYINPDLEQDMGVGEYLFKISGAVWAGAFVAILVALGATVLISRGILRPVEELTAAAKKMQTGDLSARVNPTGQDEVGQLGASFNAMAEGLAKQEQLRKNMVSDVAHELRTPLANISGYLEAARDGLVTPDAALVDNLSEEANILRRLIDDLQELAQAEAGKLRLEVEEVQLAEVIRATTEQFAPVCLRKGLELTWDLPENLPSVKADALRVAQVLRNLVSNALEYTPSGGKITLSARAAGEMVRVSVQDSGTGIAAEHLPYVFERFYRADPARARNGGGSGLGLAIVRQLIRAQGGQVAVESEPGRGSTFSFTLPVS